MIRGFLFLNSNEKWFDLSLAYWLMLKQLY